MGGRVLVLFVLLKEMHWHYLRDWMKDFRSGEELLNTLIN